MTSHSDSPQSSDYWCSSCDLRFSEVMQEAEARCPSCLKITSVNLFDSAPTTAPSTYSRMAYPLVFGALALVWVLFAMWVIFQTRTSTEAGRIFRLGVWATVASLALIAVEEARFAIKNRPKAPPWTPDIPLSD